MSIGTFYLDSRTGKKNLRARALTSIYLIAGLLLIGSAAVAQVPVISSVSPLVGYPASAVTITGSNFNTTATNNIVYFGATQATVTTASAGSLVVSVPAGATYMQVSVTNTASSLTGYSQYAFMPNYDNSAYLAGIVNFAPHVDITTGTNPWGVAIGDIDGDGKADIVVGNDGGNSVSVFRNISTTGTLTAGSFAAPVTLTAGTNADNIAIADLDGDGKLDVAVTNFGSASVSVFRNISSIGTIAFTLKADFTTAGGPEGITAGDVDGDGKPEIITSNTGSGSIGISVLQNNCTPGTISFGTKVDFATSSFSSGVVIGDIDGDGKADLAASNFNLNSISVLRNTATAGTINAASFAAKVDFATGNAPHGLAIGDIDGDGKPELISSNFNGESVSILRNTSSSGAIDLTSFAGKVDFGTLATGPFSVALGDVDGDGKADIAVGYNTNTQISVYRNTSVPGTINASSLAVEVDFTANNKPRILVMGDLDGDGKADIVTTDQSVAKISVLRNEPLMPITGVTTICQAGPTSTLSEVAHGGTWVSGTPGLATVGASTGIVAGITAGTAVISYIVPGGYATTTITVNPAPVATFTVNPNPVCFNTASVFTGGTTDITDYAWKFGDATTASGNGVSHLYALAGSYTASLTITNSFGCLATSSVIVTVNVLPIPTFTLIPAANLCPRTSASYITQLGGGINNYIWSVPGTAGIDYTVTTGGTGTGSYSVTLNWISPGAKAVTVNYRDANGCTGAAPATNTTTVLAPPTVTAVSPIVGFPSSSVTITGTNFSATNTNNIVFFGATQASVTTANATSLTVNVPLGAVYGPVNVETNTCGLQANSASAFLHNYNNAAYVANTINFDPKTDITVANNPTGMYTGDIDGDGKADMVVANSGSNTVSVYLNTSTSGSLSAASFGPVQLFTVGTSPADVTLGDIDGDGKLDVVTANSGTGNVSVLRNTSITGTISFAPQVTFTTGTLPSSVRTADLDADGKPEIVVSNRTSDNVAVLKNTSTPGSISFAAHVDFNAGGAGIYNTVIADIDGDSKPDLITADVTTSKVSVFRNTTTTGVISGSSFATHVDFAAGSNPVVAVADIDGDGKLDVLTANNGSNTLSVLRNASGIGSVSFSGQVTFATGTQPAGIALADANGDGKNDVFVANNGSNTVSVFRNTATSGAITTSSLAAKADYSAGIGAAWVVAGDLDGDGKADMATANTTAGSISLFRNDPLQPITGAAAICQNGPTTTLSEVAPGGTWSSNAPATASVGSTTGVVTGLLAGTAVISYIAPGGFTTKTIIVNPAPVATFTATPNPVCIGVATVFSNAASGITSYTWDFGDAATTTGNNVSHTYAASGNYTATLTVDNSFGCLATATKVVSVNPVPALSSGLTPAGICNNTVFNYTPVSTVGSTTFFWTRASVTDISNTAGSGTGNPGERLHNTGINPVAVVYVYSLSAGGCSQTQNVTVAVNPTPALTNTLTPAPICNNTVFDYPAGSATTGATFEWSRATVANISNAAGHGFGNPLETLNNTSANPVAVTYIYSVGINACINIQNVSVVVNPTPVLSTTLTPAAICNNTAFSYPAASATSGTAFAWTRAVVANISNGAAEGTGNPGETLVNTGSEPVVVTYVYTLTANSCTNTQNVLVSVNPTPVLSSTLTPAPVCNSTTFNYIPASATTDATFRWSRATVADISNAAANGTGNPAETLTNTGINPVLVTYVYTVTVNGCSNTQNVQVSVNPTPSLNTPLTNGAICDNTLFTYTPGSATSDIQFLWYRPAIAEIANPATSGGYGVSEVLNNTSADNVVVTYQYTMRLNGCDRVQHVTVTVNAAPVMTSTLTPASICNGSVFHYNPESSASSATFKWRRAAITGITNAAAAGTDDPAETLTNATTGAIGVVYVYTVTVGACVNAQNVVVTVNPTPVLSSTLTPAPVCSGSVFDYTPASETDGATFRWSRTAVTGLSNAANSGTGNPMETLTDTSTHAVAVVYTYTVTIDGCSNTQAVNVTVNPMPVLTSTLTPGAICNLTEFNYTPTSAITGITFAWSRAVLTGITNAAMTGADDPAETLENISADPIEVVYTYALTANGCTNLQNVVLTVNPTPVLDIASLPQATLCDSSRFDYTPASLTAGTTFTWSRSAVTGLLNDSTGGTGNPLEQLIDTTAAPVVVTYTYTLTANGCSNTEQIVVTVNPTPILTGTLTAAPICSGGLFSYAPASNTVGTTFAWRRDSVAGIANDTASGLGDPAEVLVNTTPDPLVVTYRYTLSANGCSHLENVTVVVNPNPVLVTTPVSASICDNTTFFYASSSLTAGTTFNWSRDAIAGIDNIAGSGIDTVNELLSNTTTDPIAVTYVNILSANGCTDTVNIVVTVNPLPVLSSTLTPTGICDSTAFNYMGTALMPGSTLAWHRPFIPGLSNLGGSGIDTVSETLYNTTNSPIDVVYIYTVTANGCSNIQEVTVTVFPYPLLSTPLSRSICDSAAFNYAPASSVSGFEYSWVRPFVSGIDKPAGSGSGSISDTLINTTNFNVDVIYRFTTGANGCSDSQNVVVTVHPTPLLTTPLTIPALCSGGKVEYVPNSVTPGISYSWSRGTNTNVAPESGSGVGNISEAVINTSADIQHLIYVVTMHIGSCTHSEDVLVDLKTKGAGPVITTAAPTTVCNNTMNQNFGAALPPAAGGAYVWSATGASIVATGGNGQFCIVDFDAPGTAVVTLTATDSLGCTTDTSYTVSVGTSSSVQPYVVYAGGEFICLENDVTGYQWGYDVKTTLDSTILAGQINQAYVNAAPDTLNNYYWVMTTQGSCMSKAYYNAPAGTTAVVNIDGTTSVSVYPNPGTDHVNVDIKTTAMGKVLVTMADLLGKQISNSTAVNNKATIEVSKLAPGVYVIECYRDGLKIGAAKFVKN